MPKISRIKDNIITIKGKENYKLNERYKLAERTYGVVLSARDESAELLLMGDPSNVKIDDEVHKLKEIPKIEVYEHYFGKIITPFGDMVHPADAKEPTKPKLLGSEYRYHPSPSILERRGLTEPLETGLIAIDTMIPIGRGQRELIIGDRSTGKTSIALSAIINQKNKNMKSIYIAIGQKRNSVIQVYNTLEEHGALDSTIIMYANLDSTSQQYLAPTIGMAMAEAIAYQGEDVLVVIDDLTKHANVYREIMLSVGKSPGREAYPTDMFYQHSMLLERSGRFNDKYNSGSITTLPIVETVEGDIASLIVSNVVSITDGQIFTSPEMFNKGLYPAINVQLSVSRTGSAVQSDLMRKMSTGFKSEHAALSELKKFLDMSIDISDDMIKKAKKWGAINNLLVQHGYNGYTKEQMYILIELYKMNKLNDIKNSIHFSNAFKSVCKLDKAAEALIARIVKNDFDKELIREQIATIFGPLADIASGERSELYSESEFERLRGVKHG